MGGLGRIVTAATLALGLAMGTAAHATNTKLLYYFPGPTGSMPTDTSFSATFNAEAGIGVAAFYLDGYLSLDGQNFYEDDFALSLNGTPLVSATFNLGGGGDDATYFAPIGSFIFNISGNGNQTTFTGGEVLIDIPMTFIKGLNTITWSYDSLPPPDHAGFQGLGDEGWGLSLVTVGELSAPEPVTWSLMIMGFGAAGAMLRRARQLANA